MTMNENIIGRELKAHYDSLIKQGKMKGIASVVVEPDDTFQFVVTENGNMFDLIHMLEFLRRGLNDDMEEKRSTQG